VAGNVTDLRLQAGGPALNNPTFVLVLNSTTSSQTIVFVSEYESASGQGQVTRFLVTPNGSSPPAVVQEAFFGPVDFPAGLDSDGSFLYVCSALSTSGAVYQIPLNITTKASPAPPRRSPSRAPRELRSWPHGVSLWIPAAGSSSRWAFS